MWPIPYKFIITGFFLLSIICFAGFKNLNTFTPPEVDVKNHVADKLHELKGVTKALQTTVVNKTAGLPSIQKKFFTLREIYKEVEFLICYLDAEVGEHFNGANLVSGDPDILSTKMIEPRGMQVMEEILFSDEEEKDLTAMAVLCTQMLEDITLFEKQLNKTPITTTMLFDASRKEVLRIAFLGLTGFDSPVAKNSIPEAITALQAVQKVIKAYSASIQNEKLLNDVNNTFEEAILYLQKNTDFNSFDRAHFIREYSNVLYSMLLDVHNAVGAVYPETLTDFNIPVNYEARNPFSENFLNAHFYNSNKTDNPTDARIVLGKTLFFDPVLSVNTKRACASCHQPGKAFTDGLAKSLALDFSGTVKRNAPTVINAALQGSYFYDVRAEFPESQVDHVVFNKDEFNTSYAAITETLKKMPEYVSMFQQAFPDQPASAINQFTITKALADYVRSLIAMDTEFDKYMRYETATISENVKNGFNMFMGKAQCGTCHFAPTFYGTVPPDFTESETEVLGVPLNSDTLNPMPDTDDGRFDIQNVPVYKNAFKTQTVRNIQLTAPYMHNGVYSTLEEVMDFYNRGGGAGLGFDLDNQTLPTDELNLTKTEIADIIAFMQSLTDTTGLTSIPASLPLFPGNTELSNRKIGGEY